MEPKIILTMVVLFNVMMLILICFILDKIDEKCHRIFNAIHALNNERLKALKIGIEKCED